MKKAFLFILIIIAFTTSVPLFAEEEPFNLEIAIQSELPEVEEQIKKSKTKSCVGKWEYKTKTDRIVIECLSNGSMQIKQTSKDLKIYWKGVYTVSSNMILFHVHQTVTKQKHQKSTNFDDYFWTIAYKMTGPKQMTFYSTVEPNSSTKFRYTAERQFKKVRN